MSRINRFLAPGTDWLEDTQDDLVDDVESSPVDNPTESPETEDKPRDERAYDVCDTSVTVELHCGMCSPIATAILNKVGKIEKDQQRKEDKSAIALAHTLFHYVNNDNVREHRNKYWPMWYVVHIRYDEDNNPERLKLILSKHVLRPVGESLMESRNGAVVGLGAKLLSLADKLFMKKSGE